MALESGSSLGAYEIIGLLGAGGMGEVYRARDTKLGRDVALKILPDSFAGDPDRVARFQREAQVLASLNHPQIGAIYGLEDANGLRALVLELVEGPTLADRIARGPIPAEEALPIARQIAEALEAAHEQGVIHRDLKPANIKLRPDGVVKVLDFGLAKLAEPPTASGVPSVTQSPTITTPAHLRQGYGGQAMTGVGMILGTAAYMSPEQAKGRPADKRSDVWAFGAVLFEMLSGRRAFEGEEVSDTLAAVLRSEPDWTALPPSTPLALRKLVRRCLEKDRRRRLADIADARFELDEASNPVAADAGSQPAPARETGRRSAAAWKIASAALALMAIAALVMVYRARERSAEVTRFYIAPPDKTQFITSSNAAASAIISPDGRRIAFTAKDAAGNSLLWVRSIDSLTAQPLPGTDEATYPFWSPDSRFLGYFSRGKVMKIAASGGPAQTICAITTGTRGGAWGQDNVIILNGGTSGAGLLRVSASGGEPSPALPAVKGLIGGVFPSLLPDSRHMLFYGYAPATDVAGIYLASLDTGEAKRLIWADSNALYSEGHLLFVRQGTLFAQPFNAGTLTLSDEAFPVAEHVESNSPNGMPSFSVSDNGHLVYGVRAGTGNMRMVWVDRQGNVGRTVGPPQNYRGLDLSPDGTQVAAHRHDDAGGDIWVTDVSSGTTSRFTFDAEQDNSSPIWSPDGRRIAFASLRGGRWGVYAKASDMTGAEERLLVSESLGSVPMGWSPDGSSIVYWTPAGTTRADLWLLPLAGDRAPVPLLRGPFNESHGQISPDGRWIAYQSNEAGQYQVYVQPFPSGPGKRQISAGGGAAPRWRRDGRELFFRTPSKLLAVDVRTTESSFIAGTPRELFDHSTSLNNHTGGNFFDYAVSADGQRFLVTRSDSPAGEHETTPLAVVLNWAAGLKK